MYFKMGVTKFLNIYITVGSPELVQVISSSKRVKLETCKKTYAITNKYKMKCELPCNKFGDWEQNKTELNFQ